MTYFAALAPVVGRAPSDWSRVEFRRLATLRESPNQDSGSVPLSLSQTGLVSPRSADAGQQPSVDYLRRYWKVRPGDLVVNPMWLIGGAIGVSEVTGAVSPDYRVYQLRAEVHPRFLHYLMRSGPYFEQYKLLVRANTTFDRRITKADFHPIPALVPPLDVQRAIADFLDTVTARIDALITKKRRLMETIDERARAAYIQLVLGEAPSMASASTSGLFKGVPDGWRETALRHLGCSVQTGPFGSQLHAEEYVEGGWPVVNPMNLVAGTISPVSTMTITDEKRAELARHILEEGDIVFGRRGEMGRAGLVTTEHVGWLCGTGSLRLRLTGVWLNPAYLALLLGTAAVRAYFELASVGSTMDNLNSQIVLACPVLVPPPDVQERTVAEVNEVRAWSRRVSEALEIQVDLLVEHRQALITAAVTGELEIPRVAA